MYSAQYTKEALDSLHDYMKMNVDYRVWKWTVKTNEGRQTGWMKVEYLLDDWNEAPLNEIMEVQEAVWRMHTDCNCCVKPDELMDWGFGPEGFWGFSVGLVW